VCTVGRHLRPIVDWIAAAAPLRAQRHQCNQCDQCDQCDGLRVLPGREDQPASAGKVAEGPVRMRTAGMGWRHRFRSPEPRAGAGIRVLMPENWARVLLRSLDMSEAGRRRGAVVAAKG
jgi:hypothetical protein